MCIRFCRRARIARGGSSRQLKNREWSHCRTCALTATDSRWKNTCVGFRGGMGRNSVTCGARRASASTIGGAGEGVPGPRSAAGRVRDSRTRSQERMGGGCAVQVLGEAEIFKRKAEGVRMDELRRFIKVDKHEARSACRALVVFRGTPTDAWATQSSDEVPQLASWQRRGNVASYRYMTHGGLHGFATVSPPTLGKLEPSLPLPRLVGTCPVRCFERSPPPAEVTHHPPGLCPNCGICLRTKITRASCTRRTGTVVPRAERFGDLITADHKVLSGESESRNNHRCAVVVQDLATQWIQSYPCKPEVSGDPEEVLGADEQTQSHLHCQFLGTWQVLRRIIMESWYVNTTQI